MQPRTPRLEVPKRTFIQDFIALGHPMMFAPILCFLVAGTFLAPEVSYTKFMVLVIGVTFGVILGAYRLNAIKDGGSVLSKKDNLILASLGILVLLSLLAISAAVWGWPVLLMGALGIFAIVVYNSTRNKVIHNSLIYGICWGTFPIVLAYCFQVMSWPSPQALVLGAMAAVFARAYTWNHGLRTCGVHAICLRQKGEHTCHSNSITCDDRLVMPRRINDHAKMRLRMDLAMAILLAVFIILQVS